MPWWFFLSMVNYLKLIINNSTSIEAEIEDYTKESSLR